MTPTQMAAQHGENAGLSAPWLHSFAISKHDSNNLDHASRGVFVGTGGNVVVITIYDETVAFNNVPDGTLLPVVAKRINSTNTTASDFVGGY